MKNTVGKDHPSYSISLNHLAKLYNTLEQYDKAIFYGLQALKFREIIFGNNHSKVVDVLKLLSEIYSKSGDLKKATEIENRLNQISVENQ